MRTKSLNDVLLQCLVGILLVVFGVIVLHAPLIVSAESIWPGGALLVKSWKEILLGIGLILAIVLVIRRKMVRSLLRDRLMQFTLAYTAIHLAVMPANWQGFGATAAGLMIDLRYVLFFALVYIVLKMAPEYKRMFVKVGVIGAAVVLGFALLQVFVLPKDFLGILGYGRDTIAPYLTVDQNHDFIRINSTLRGPNSVGAYALIALTLLATYMFKQRAQRTPKQLALFGLIGAGGVVALWASYSRSALVAAIVSLLIVAIIMWGKKVNLKYGLIFAGVVVAGSLALFAFKDSSFVSNVLLHENPQGGSAVSSNEGHIDSLQDGVARMAVQPLGAGIGSTGSASLFGDEPLIIENQYLFIAHEVGWFGLIYFLILFGFILTMLWRKRSDWLALGVFASGIGLALVGLLLPVWADDTIGIVWWGLAAVALTGTINKKGTKHDTRKTSPR